MTAALICGAMAGEVKGQTATLSLLGFVPPVQRTNQATVTLQYNVSATPTGLVDVFFFLSDGTQTTVAGVNPAGGPFTTTIPLPTAPTDGVTFTLSGIVRRQDTGSIAIGSPTLSIIVDNVGPRSLALTSPTFPTTAFVSPLVIRGSVRNSTGPEPGGTVLVRRQDPAASGQLVGAGAILAGGTFIASVDLAGFPIGVAVPISIQAFDLTGNAGASITVTITNADPKRKVVAENLQLIPAAGSLTNVPAAMVAGDLKGDVGPLTATFVVDGAIESQVAGLASGQPFRHTIGLLGDGPHSFTLRARDGLGNEAETSLGSVTLKTSPPSPPTLLSPAIVVSNQNTFTIQGLVSRDAMAPGSGQLPKVLVRGPSAARYTPPQPQLVTDPSGLFQTTADVSALPDGTYAFEITAIDAAGNSSTVTTVAAGHTQGPTALGRSRGDAAATAAGLPQDLRRRTLSAILDLPRKE